MAEETSARRALWGFASLTARLAGLAEVLFRPYNMAGVCVSVLLMQLLGAMWFSPVLVGKRFFRLLKKFRNLADAKITESGYPMSICFASSFVTAVVQSVALLLVLDSLDISNAAGALIVAFFLWAGFHATSLEAAVWQGMPSELMVINEGKAFACILLQSLVLQSLRE